MSEKRQSVADFAEINGARVFYEVGGTDHPLLLLHAGVADSRMWDDQWAVFAQHYRVIRCDLPGFGQSKGARIDRGRFLEELIPALGLARPVIVSPSMSGSFSFPYVLAHPEAVAGFVPVAPAGAAEYTARLHGSPVPTLVVWGERDTVFPISLAQPLADAFTDARVLVLPGARHPAYLDQPELFHRELVAFATGVSGRERAPAPQGLRRTRALDPAR